MLLFEIGILLLCIVVGARCGGIALGTVSGIELVVFVLVLGMPPGNPPAVVLGMILAVITALSMMEAAGPAGRCRATPGDRFIRRVSWRRGTRCAAGAFSRFATGLRGGHRHCHRHPPGEHEPAYYDHHARGRWHYLARIQGQPGGNHCYSGSGGRCAGLTRAYTGRYVPGRERQFFLPTYGTVLAAASFDQTGTTRIGKYLLNHSFMLPGLVTTINATLAGLFLGKLLLA